MTQLKASDMAAPLGILTIAKDYHDGKGRQTVFQEKNLIVKEAKRYLLSGLYQAGVVSDPIVSLKVGTGGNIDTEGLYPKPEDPDQTNLITPLLSINTVYTLDVPNITVTYLADLDQSQGNGSQLSEAGLFLASGKIFNVKNHPGITKTSQFSIHYSWAIKFL